MAFSDRATRDIGPLQLRKVDRNQVYGGRLRHDDPAPALAGRPVLFEKSLDWQSGMHLRRFAMRLTSRYLALDPASRPALTRYTHFGQDNRIAPSWMNLAVPDRPSGRKIRRPAIALVLPLTESANDRDPTPPLLVLLNERIHADHNIADQIEAIVETARHPLTELDEVDLLIKTEQDPERLKALQDRRSGLLESEGAQKYWPEIGPDPIRTGKSHDGRQVPIRQEGPIGYGFDIGAEAGRFGSAGILVQAAGESVPPWSMVKLRFRRFEPPEAVFRTDDAEPGKALRSEKFAPTEDETPLRLPLRNREGDETFDGLDHEGVAIDVRIAAEDSGSFKVGFDAALAATEAVTLRYHVAESLLSIWAETPLGPTARATIQLGRVTRLRATVSHVDPPGDAEKWRPAGNMVIKTLIEGPDIPDAGHWLTLTDVPILSATEQDVGLPVDLYLKHLDGPSPLTARPLRLSGLHQRDLVPIYREHVCISGTIGKRRR